MLLFYNLCFCEVDIIGSRLYIDSSELEIEPRPILPTAFRHQHNHHQQYFKSVKYWQTCHHSEH